MRWLLAALLLAATPARAAEWSRYQIVIWHTHGPARLAGARRLGVTAGMAFGVRDDGADPGAELTRHVSPLRAAGLGFYIGNIATDFYAAYHRWRPDHPLTWLFDQARARHAADPADLAAFMRQPSLSDPAELARIESRLRAHVRALGAAPLYYSLGDETGIADLTAAWDFDFSAPSLAGFRNWLRGEYRSPAALNQEWGTSFPNWDAVVPLTTDAALRQDGTFAGWADFKAWMDVAFARAIRAGVDAVHRANPAARAAIEGAQVPGWGGYDYTLLAPALDVMETAADAPSQDIAQAMNPSLITLTTVAGEGPADADRLWRAALAGGRGTILWDPDAEIVGKDGAPGPRWAALSGVLGELGGPIGARLVASTPLHDPVAILYSPASFRARWILDRRAEAATHDWSHRTSEDEIGDTAWRVALRQASDSLAHLGLQPRFLSPSLLTSGGLRGVRVLILPHALALSDGEIAAIAAFARGGGTVLADIAPGGYDQHIRRRAAPMGEHVTLLPDLSRASLAAPVASAGVTPIATVTHADGTPVGNVSLRARRVGRGIILAVQRDFAPGADHVVLTLPHAQWVRDLRGGARRFDARIELTVDGVTPALLEIGPRR